MQKHSRWVDVCAALRRKRSVRPPIVRARIDRQMPHSGWNQGCLNNPWGSSCFEPVNCVYTALFTFINDAAAVAYSLRRNSESYMLSYSWHSRASSSVTCVRSYLCSLAIVWYWSWNTQAAKKVSSRLVTSGFADLDNFISTPWQNPVYDKVSYRDSPERTRQHTRALKLSSRPEAPPDLLSRVRCACVGTTDPSVRAFAARHGLVGHAAVPRQDLRQLFRQFRRRIHQTSVGD